MYGVELAKCRVEGDKVIPGGLSQSCPDCLCSDSLTSSLLPSLPPPFFLLCGGSVVATVVSEWSLVSQSLSVCSRPALGRDLCVETHS